ncbi:MAG: hypothetical protein H6577_10545 [Lewinellaceae bacterium]|nr:hypothetical protein [Saprospiraceae bacterium]MCB9338551.1 hypothetical protein [Lewinellaceae bacterium]
MEKQENLHKELEFIQAVILRMANNSFLVKGWAMTLMAGLIALGKDVLFDENQGNVYLIVIIALVIPFWWLDAFYLRQERIFRKIYERAIDDPDAKNRKRYDLNPRVLATEVASTFKIMKERVIYWFYLPFIFLLALAVILRASGVI